MINFDQPSSFPNEEENKTSTDNVESDVENFEKEKSFLKDIENQGFLGEKIKEEYLEIKTGYKQQLIEMGKNPAEGETWDDLIRKEMDENYAQCIKEGVNEDDKKLIDNFLESDEKNSLSLNEKQEFLNVLFRNNNLLYANKKGELVSMTNYLREYYEGTGAEPSIEFKTIDPDVKRNLATQVLRDKFLREGLSKDKSFIKAYRAIESNDERVKYILDDGIAFPHLIVKTENTKTETPLIAGNIDLHRPLRSEEQDEFGYGKIKGHSVQSQVIHSSKYLSNIQKIVAFNIHEIDHAVREALPTESQESLDENLLIEGTAEKASMDFMSIQHEYLKNNSSTKSFDGYDYQSNLQQTVGRYALSKKGGVSEKEYRYAQGLMIAEQYSRNKGEENYKKLFYTGEFDVEEELGDVVKIREEIDEKLGPQKKMFAQILSGRLDKE